LKPAAGDPVPKVDRNCLPRWVHVEQASKATRLTKSCRPCRQLGCTQGPSTEKVGFDFEPEAGLANNGDLEHDLQASLEEVGHAAKIVKEMRCHPYFLQEWGKHAWDAADDSPTEVGDVRVASKTAIAAPWPNWVSGRTGQAALRRASSAK
jgi:hypothetical protein